MLPALPFDRAREDAEVGSNADRTLVVVADERRPRLPQRGVAGVVKRTMDVVVASVLLVLLLPVLLAAAVAIRLDSPGPALYRGVRIGRGGIRFTAFKLRSMRTDTDDRVHEQYLREALHGDARRHGIGQHQLYKLANDTRVTRVGAFLRKTSIDEIPQLLNVLQGHMSLVGPRPEVPYALAEYEPGQLRRFDVLPGLTGLWQVSGRSALTPREMIELDVRYADTWSLWLDLKILLRTPWAVIGRSGAA